MDAGFSVRSIARAAHILGVRLVDHGMNMGALPEDKAGGSG